MTARLSPLERRAAAMTEAQLLSRFYDLEDKAGLGFAFHIHDARGQRVAGCTDLITIVPDFVGGCGTVGFFEVKTMRDRLSHRQAMVLEALSACSRLASGIIRPIPREGELSLDDALKLLGLEGMFS